MTPRYTPGKNATAAFHALADLFVVHKIPGTPTWRLRASSLLPSRDIGRRHQVFLVPLPRKARIEVYRQSYEQNQKLIFAC